MLREDVGHSGDAGAKVRSHFATLEYARISFFESQGEHEIFRKAIQVTLHLFVESLDRDAVQICEILIEQDTVSAQGENSLLDNLNGSKRRCLRRVRRGSSFDLGFRFFNLRFFNHGPAFLGSRTTPSEYSRKPLSMTKVISV